MIQGDAGDEDDTVSTAALADHVDELESTIRDLRRETMQPPRGPLGLPRPPTPREFLEFTDRFAIPATVAFLEAHIKALQALQATLRFARGADETRDRVEDAQSRTAELGTKTLDALDSALDDLKDAYQEGAMPNDPEARTVLQDAQRLTNEIRHELQSARTPTGEHPSNTTADGSPGYATDDSPVDPEEVETELDVLRDEFQADGSDDDSDDTSGSAGHGSSEDGREEDDDTD